jgi:hypothetical protein
MRIALLFACFGLVFAGAASAAPSPRSLCQAECRKEYRHCVKSKIHGGRCFKSRGKCYRACRRRHRTEAPR